MKQVSTMSKVFVTSETGTNNGNNKNKTKKL